jgi:hypothetical protein
VSFGACGAVLDPGYVTISSALWGLGIQKPHRACARWGFQGKAGDGLLSHHLSVVVPSALQGLTAVFGMGTGVAPAR